MSRWRTLAAERERGLTLVELLVAMSLLAIVMTLITVLVVSVSQTFTRQESQQDSTNQAALAMQQVTRVIRSGTEIEVSSTWQPAPVFSTATPSSMMLNAYVGIESTDEGPTRVTLTVDSGRRELVETRYPSSKSGGVWVYSGTPSRTHVVVRDVTSPTPFTYLRADGSALPARALTEAERREIAAVRVTLAVQTGARADASRAELESVVSLPNLDVTRTGGS